MSEFTRIYVTRDQLVQAEACPDGLKAFDLCFPEGEAGVNTREELVELVQGPMGLWVGWAQAKGLLVIDLRGADLRGVNLRGVNLRDTNLRDTNLRGADLRGADLRGADLEGADLEGANLEGANLKGADLEWANLKGAVGLK